MAIARLGTAGALDSTRVDVLVWATLGYLTIGTIIGTVTVRSYLRYRLTEMREFTGRDLTFGSDPFTELKECLKSAANTTADTLSRDSSRCDETHGAGDVPGRFLRFSHDVRTPLSIVIGAVDLLRDTPLNPEQLEYVRTMEDATDTLLRMAGGLLGPDKARELEWPALTSHSAANDREATLRETESPSAPLPAVSPRHPDKANVTADDTVEIRSAIIQNSEVCSSRVTHNPGKKRVLIVDDNHDTVELLRTYLDEPYDVRIARNGATAVEMHKTDRFDLVVMDMEMPVLDGCMATRLIREWEQASGEPSVPIMALTGHVLDADLNRFRTAGCDSYLAKPFTRDVLLAAIREQVEKRSVSRSLGIADLAPAFLARKRNELDEFRQAASKAEFDQVRSLAHNLKGTGAGYGYPRLSEIGSGIEMAAKTRDVNRIMRLLEDLESELRKSIETEAA